MGWGQEQQRAEQGSQAREHQGMGDAVIGGIPCLWLDKGLNGRGSLMDFAGGRSPKATRTGCPPPTRTGRPTTASRTSPDGRSRTPSSFLLPSDQRGGRSSHGLIRSICTRRRPAPDAPRHKPRRRVETLVIWDERRAPCVASDTRHLASLRTGQDVTALSHILVSNAVPTRTRCSQHDPRWGLAGPLGALRPCLETSRARATAHSTATHTPTPPAPAPATSTPATIGARVTRKPTTPRIRVLPPPPPPPQTCRLLSGRECDGSNHPRAKTPSPYISRKHAALRHSTTHSSHSRHHRLRLARPPPPTRSSRPPTPIRAPPACKTSPARPPLPSPTPPLPLSQRGQWPVAMTHSSATLRL